jgi:hypothetical protein
VQFIRFAAALRELAQYVTLWVQPQLLGAVRGAAGVDGVLPLHDGTPEVEYDVDIEIMELAHALRVNSQTIRVQVPYLFKPDQPGARPGPRGDFVVGIVWQAGDWMPQRSIDPLLLAPLSKLSGVRLCSLQRGPAASLARAIPALSIGYDDVRQTAAMLRAIDLLITVDTFIAHLAGAIGIPVWLLLHDDCDWRWADKGSETIWYPTMRIFRQQGPGDWRPVVDSVIAALERARAGSRTFGTNVSV